MAIQRHKAAMARSGLSRPMQLLIQTGLLVSGGSLFDYGCGQGGDVRRLKRMGYEASGWDPHFTPNAPKSSADVVNLGFVLNVIERAQERLEVLREAWALSGEVLLVAVRSFSDTKTVPGRPYGDGYLTKIGTFQKFYDQTELKNWISSTLNIKPVPLAPGIVVLFRDDRRRQVFVSDRFRRSIAVSSALRAHSLYDSHAELFDAFHRAFLRLGRAPAESEWSDHSQLLEVAQSVRRGLSVLRHLHGREHLADVQSLRAEDLLVFLALERLEGRPRFGQLDDSLQRDVRAFFGTYKEACRQADHFLFSAGNQMLTDAGCRDSAVGKLTPNALFVHASALPTLEGILRVVEGCSRSLVGTIDGANVIKIHRRKPAVSYLSYPEFDRVAHPALRFSVSVDLSGLRAKWHDFEGRENPPILHRKELMVAEDYPGREKFARLSRQEERAGLLSRSDIGTLDGWDRTLQEAGRVVRGHRMAPKGPQVAEK
jgi:DNA phosphorothioation-associated putative methyltransferase